MNELRYAIIIPVQNEEEVLGATLDELQKFLPAHSKISVGLNACEDRSREICIAKGIVFGETSESGYGWGCMAAIKAVEAEFPPTAYLFFAGDGANDPRDLPALIEAFELGEANFIIGIRRFDLKNWLDEFGRSLPNLILGLVCRALGGQFFHDLGPLRLIERDLFQKMQLREMVWGWTIEAQLLAAKHGEKIVTREVIERPRLAGQQKVSGVSMARSARVGWEIGKAAIRTKLRR